MILKLQKPLAGNMNPQILVYSKNKRVLALVPYLPKEVWDKWFGTLNKRFILGSLKDGLLHIYREVPDEDW